MGTINITPMSRTDSVLPVLIVAGAGADMSTTTTSSETALPENTGDYWRLLADEAVYVDLNMFNGNVAMAGDFLLAAGIPEYIKNTGQMYIAAKDQA